MSEINTNSKNRIAIDQKHKVLRSFFNRQINNNLSFEEENKELTNKTSQKNLHLKL